MSNNCPMSDVRRPMSFAADVRGVEISLLDSDRQWMVLAINVAASTMNGGCPTSDIGHRTSDEVAHA